MNVFSEREQKILKIIGRRKMTIEQVTCELFKQGNKPFEPTISVANSISRIIKKCHYHETDWVLTKKREDSRLYIKKEKRNDIGH